MEAVTPRALTGDKLTPEQRQALRTSGLLGQLTPGTHITAEVMDAVMANAAAVAEHGLCGDSGRCAKPAGHQPDDPWHAYGTGKWRTDEHNQGDHHDR